MKEFQSHLMLNGLGHRCARSMFKRISHIREVLDQKDRWHTRISPLDSMRGDATLFTRRDEVEAEWRIITPIEEAWAEVPAPQFPNYASGSEGPKSGGRFIKGAGREWTPITQ